MSEDSILAMVRLTGELDSHVAAHVGPPLREFVRFARDVVVDAAGIEFIDSAGLRLLEELAGSASSVGGSFALHDPSRFVMRLIRLTGSSEVFDTCHPTRRHAAARSARRRPRKVPPTPSSSSTLSVTFLG